MASWAGFGRFLIDALKAYGTPPAPPPVVPFPTKPEPPPVVDAPVAPPAPVLTLEQRFGDQVRAIYAEELRRMPDPMELWEGMQLLNDGRADELRANLQGRGRA